MNILKYIKFILSKVKIIVITLIIDLNIILINKDLGNFFTEIKQSI